MSKSLTKADLLSPLLTRRSFLFSLTAFAFLPLEKADAAFTFEPFRFGYLTGSYLATKRPDNFRMVQESQLFLQDAVKQLNQEGLDFMLFGGDQVELPGKDDENWQLFIDIVQGLNCPWNFVLGEHDVSGVVNKMDTYGRDWKGKGITSPKAYWSTDPKNGVHMIGLDTSQSDLTVGAISDAQLDWLKRDLDGNRGKFTIVLSHHPLLPPTPFDSGPPWEDWTVPQGANAREIMAAHADVRLALSGHVHINKIQQEEKIWYVSSPSLAVFPCAFRVFRVAPQFIAVETYQISYGALIKKAKKAIESWSLAYKYSSKVEAFCDLLEGSKEDQNVRLSLLSGKKIEIDQPKRKKQKDKDKGKGKDKDNGEKEEKPKKRKGEEEPAKREPPQPAKKEESGVVPAPTGAPPANDKENAKQNPADAKSPGQVDAEK